VVEAFKVAEAKYNAAFTVSVVGEVRLVREVIVDVPSWCCPSINSDMKLVQSD